MMNALQLEKRLTELEFLSGSIDLMDDFNRLYESMLNDARGDLGPLKRLKGLSLRQTAYLMNAWIEAKREHDATMRMIS